MKGALAASLLGALSSCAGPKTSVRDPGLDLPTVAQPDDQPGHALTQLQVLLAESPHERVCENILDLIHSVGGYQAQRDLVCAVGPSAFEHFASRLTATEEYVVRELETLVFIAQMGIVFQSFQLPQKLTKQSSHDEVSEVLAQLEQAYQDQAKGLSSHFRKFAGHEPSEAIEVYVKGLALGEIQFETLKSEVEHSTQMGEVSASQIEQLNLHLLSLQIRRDCPSVVVDVYETNAWTSTEVQRLREALSRLNQSVLAGNLITFQRIQESEGGSIESGGYQSPGVITFFDSAFEDREPSYPASAVPGSSWFEYVVFHEYAHHLIPNQGDQPLLIDPTIARALGWRVLEGSPNSPGAREMSRASEEQFQQISSNESFLSALSRFADFYQLGEVRPKGLMVNPNADVMIASLQVGEERLSGFFVKLDNEWIFPGESALIDGEERFVILADLGFLTLSADNPGFKSAYWMTSPAEHIAELVALSFFDMSAVQTANPYVGRLIERLFHNPAR